MEPCKSFEDVLSLLGLDIYFPCKITLRHVFEAKLTDKFELKDIKWAILNKIINVDLRARDGVLSDILDIVNKQDVEEKKSKTMQSEELTKSRRRPKKQASLFHPQDVFTAIYLCCSPFLKQLIVSKLFMCRIAVPVIFSSTRLTEGFFWPFNFVATDGLNSTGKMFKGFLSDQDIKIVSFIRLGEITFSKSDFLNNVLSNDPFFQTFYSRNCPLGSNSKRTFGGTVEATHFVPYGQTKTDSFDDVILFLNLRGNAVQYPLLFEVTKSVSDVVLVLLQTTNLKNDAKIAETLTSIYQSSCSVIIALESNLNDDEEDLLYDKLQNIAKISNSKFYCIDLKADGQIKGMNEIVKDTQSDILKCLSNVNCLPFSRVRHVLDHYGIPCDYAVKECVEGCTLADKMFDIIDTKSASIQHFWIEMSKLKKKKYREKSLPRKRDIEKQIQHIRSQQLKHISHLPQMSTAMLQILYDLKDFPETLMFFLKSLKLLLDKRSKKMLPGLLSRYNTLSKESKKAGSDKDQLERKIENIKIEIEDASFGVEHLMREVVQIFEALTNAPGKAGCNNHVLEYVENCPSIAANLLIEGYPLEVMDGAASDVPLVWIKQVFTCLEIKIGSTAKLLTLSIMGIQSSGKSTLLNAMFGLQLAVSTGRCTKGVFLQLIPMPKDQFPFQYVLVFDTEGLRSNEYRESMVTHAHDNQLATFVVGVGDITLINIRGENMSEVSDILEIVVHAFIRMKKVNENFELQQSCIFVHQDVADTNAKSNLLPGTLQLVSCLDKITNEAAEQEHLPNCHSFDKIIHFNHEKHVFYFPNLWRGTPPLCAINTEYSENVDRLRRFLMSDISERRKTYFTVQEICSKINDLWEAILSEDFVFSFKNGIELKAERAAESMFFELRRKLEKTVSQFLLNDAKPAFRNCENEDKLDKVKLEIEDKLTERLSSSFENLKKEWSDFIEGAPLRDIIIQWKENRMNQLEIYKNEEQLSALKDIYMIEKRIRLEIREKIILTPKEMEDWKYHANNVVEKCTEHPLDNDIKEVFENLWAAELRRFSTEDTGEKLSIDDEIWKIVINYFQNDRIYLMRELTIFKQIEEKLEQTGQLKGCIKEIDITSRHLSGVSGERLETERKIALTMVNDLFSEIEIFVRSRENKDFDIIEIREIFDKFLKTYQKYDDEARNYKFSFSKNFKGMLAVYIWKYLGSVYQQIHDDFEKISGLQTKRINYKKTLLNNFRKLISEAMKLKTEKIRRRKEEEKIRKQKDEAERMKREEEIINENKLAEAELKALKIRKEQEVETNKKKLESEFQIKQKEELNRQKELALKLQEEKRKTKEQKDQLEAMERQRQVKEQERKQDEGTASSIENIMVDCIISHVAILLQNKGVNEILSKFKSLKRNLIKFIMVSLAENEYFNDFYTYLHSTTYYVNTFIQILTDKFVFTGDRDYSKWVQSQVDSLIKEVEKAVNSAGQVGISNMETWSTYLCQQLRFIDIPNNSSVRSINVYNINDFTGFILDNLKTAKTSCISHFKQVSSFSPVRLLDRNPYEQILEKLWGCEERCPFCSEPCVEPTKYHAKSHSCLQHRPDGVSGWHWQKTKILSLDTCDANVASENVFFCNENRFSCQEDRNHNKHKFRNYKTFDPSWYIPPDNNLSESKYWAWYVCRFEEQIKSKYGVNYPSLPYDWKQITKKEAIKSLDLPDDLKQLLFL